MKPQPAYTITPMRLSDIAQVLAVQASAYPAHLLEDAAFFRNRLALSPSTCWVARPANAPAFAPANAPLLGYLIAYPWADGLPPALNAPLHTLPSPATTWFLHDCAVAAHCQGLGVGQALYRTAAAHAQAVGLRQAALVALESAVGYWRKQGYAEPARSLPGMAHKLSGYGAGARYLTRALAARRGH